MFCLISGLSVIIGVGIAIIIHLIAKHRSILEEMRNKVEELESTQRKMYHDLERQRAKNREFEKDAEKEVKLYEIIKDLTKTLDEIEMFRIFKERLKEYIQVEDCIFIDSTHLSLTHSLEYYLFPIRVENDIRGYLAVKGCREEDLDLFHILANQFALGMRRIKLYRAIEEMAITDELTGVYVRRYVLDRFFESLLRANKFNSPLGFLMIDVDNFKKINDCYGHLVGDAVLREVANRIKSTAREIDLVGRYGGEEFCVILLDTDKEGARRAGERICKVVSEKPIIAYNETLEVTVSVGVASFPDDGKDPYSIIEVADRALYEAKHLGKNRTVVLGQG